MADYDELGRCLMFLRQFRDASIAFEQEFYYSAEDTDRADVFHKAWCDDCKKIISRTLRYVCMECPCTDLCESCRDRSGGFHRDSKESFSHELMVIPSKGWPGKKTDKVNALGETRLQSLEWVQRAFGSKRSQRSESTPPRVRNDSRFVVRKEDDEEDEQKDQGEKAKNIRKRKRSGLEQEKRRYRPNIPRSLTYRRRSF